MSSKKRYGCNVLNLRRFILDYYGISCDNFNKITHNELRIMFPDINPVLVDSYFNQWDKVYAGDILMVEDKNKSIRAYENPLRHGLIIKGEEEVDIDIIERESYNIDFESLSEKDLYKLRELLQVAKRAHDSKGYRMILDEIVIKREGIPDNTVKKRRLKRVLDKEQLEY